MVRIFLQTALVFSMLSCGSNTDEKDDNNSSETKTTEMKNKKNDKFGDWETDDQGTKFREDYELKQELSGYELVKYTRINGGQFGGGTSTTKFTLCSDGSIKYYFQSLTTVSVDGAGGSDASQDEDYGTWKAIENEKGVKLLVFKSTKHGNTGFMELKLDGSKVQMVWYNEWQEFLKKKIDC